MSALPACFQYLPGWAADQGMTDYLVRTLAWQQPTIRMFGQEILTPRLTAWIGDGPYTYSGVRHVPAAWDPMLRRYRDALEAAAGARFNSCLANHYRGGQDSVGWHADDEPELGSEPVIASMSLGARRRFQIRHRASGETWSVDLGQGDLLVMRGESQRDYVHAVPKTRRPIGVRVNLTFRWVNS